MHTSAQARRRVLNQAQLVLQSLELAQPAPGRRMLVQNMKDLIRRLETTLTINA